jgi:hypothetical protein
MWREPSLDLCSKATTGIQRISMMVLITSLRASISERQALRFQPRCVGPSRSRSEIGPNHERLTQSLTWHAHMRHEGHSLCFPRKKCRTMRCSASRTVNASQTINACGILGEMYHRKDEAIDSKELRLFFDNRSVALHGGHASRRYSASPRANSLDLHEGSMDYVGSVYFAWMVMSAWRFERQSILPSE